MMLCDVLTPEENAELDNNPYGTIGASINLDATQFALRLGIAKKMCQFMLDYDDPSKDEVIRAIYKKYPMWQFYEDKETKRPMRMYGIADADNEVLHMAAASLGMIYTKEVSAKDLQPIDRWNENQPMWIKMSGHSGPPVFYDPCGFILVVDQYST